MTRRSTGRDRVQFTARIERQIYMGLQEYAFDHDISVNLALERAIKQYIVSPVIVKPPAVMQTFQENR